MDPDILNRCWFLAGPTACGKTELSLELAGRLNAEIVALDSMTIYRGMDIGTAKATRDEQARVPHHMIDVADPHEEYSLAEYLSAAESSCRTIIDRGRTPLFVGGTGLYLRGVLRGVFEGPEADWSLRRELESRSQAEGVESLHHELAAIDPITATRLHPNDTRRVIRAIEVFRQTGRPISEQQVQPPRNLDERTPHVYWLNPRREWLYDRINRRVECMFTSGLLEEVVGLSKLTPPIGRSARQALGYKEVFDWLSDRRESEPVLEPPRALIESIQTRTRQFAKRQLTWFRNLEECVPIELTGDDSIPELASRIAQRL